MSDADTLIDQLLASETDEEREACRAAFEGLPTSEKEAAEKRLIRLLNDMGVDKVPRSWVTTMLGLVGTPSAKEALVARLPVEKMDLVRRWAARNLRVFFDGDETAILLAEQLDRERTYYDRFWFAVELSRSQSLLAFPKLVELLNEPFPDVRYQALVGIRDSSQREKALQPLVRRLDEEDNSYVKQLILEILGEIGDPLVLPTLIAQVQRPTQSFDVQVAAVRALVRTSAPTDVEAVQALLEAACRPDPVFSIAGTQGLMDLLTPDNAARRLADFGLQHTDPEVVPRAANALRFIGGTAAVEYLGTTQGERAERLLEEIGRRPAVDVLLRRRLETLTEARGRVEEFDAQGLTIFQDTIKQAKRGFTMSLWMSGTIFVFGVILLVLSIYLVALPDASQFQRLYGVGGGLAGLGTVLTMFYRGPLERIEQAVANLVQTEIAFLAFIRQVTQVTAMFEREYVDSEKFGIAELDTLLQYTERIMKETMPLVRRYTLGPPGEEVSDER